jgi:hypothetical protein
MGHHQDAHRHLEAADGVPQRSQAARQQKLLVVRRPNYSDVPDAVTPKGHVRAHPAVMAGASLQSGPPPGHGLAGQPSAHGSSAA